ncbi:MAG: NAD(P)-binding domain-containing protein [Xanthomonadales bacterium]|nr:NAD(P)-binding domain-containing protein [Xanthomonadales bacterium]
MRLLAGLFFVLFLAPAWADRIAIIGTGDVAGALGPRFAELGHTVVYGSREPAAERVKALVDATGHGASADTQAGAAGAADIIILAVPAGVVVSVAQSLGDLAGKILIDPTNSFRFTDQPLVEPTAETPIAVQLQEAVPDAHVVKAFNIVWYKVMIDPALAGGAMTIPLVGNDPGAKQKVARLVRELGFESSDLGPIRYAREVEGMLILWFNARLNGRPFNFYFRPEQRPG